MTKGTSESILHAELLSITTAPDFVAIGAQCLDVSPPAEKSAKSTPLNEYSFTACTLISFPQYLIVVPAERGEARGIISEIGKSLRSSVFNISRPTSPVTPRTATFFSAI